MPRTTYEMPSFGAWVEERGSLADFGFKVRSIPDAIPKYWEVTKGGLVVAKLFKEMADVLVPNTDINDAIYLLALRFERSFVDGLSRFEITINCRYQKPEQKIDNN